MSSGFFRIFLRLAIIFVIFAFAVQPYNVFCRFSNKCSPFSFAYYLPSFEGKEPINVFFEVANYRKDLDFIPDKNSITTVSGRKNIVKYYIKNTSNKTINFRSSLQIEPEKLESYIKRHQCPCSRNFKLKAGEVIEEKMIFELTKKFFEEKNADFVGDKKKDDDEEEKVILRYRIK